MRLIGLRRPARVGVLLSVVGCGPAPMDAPPPMVASAPAAPAVRARSSPAPAVPSPSRHDLSIDEQRGGHTIERHVGRTDEQLRERLRREANISAASTYTDLPVAETVVAHAFVAADSEIDRWEARSGRRPNLVIERTEPTPIGRSLRRGQRIPSPCHQAIVVLRWDERKRWSYVLTSYPDCRR